MSDSALPRIAPFTVFSILFSIVLVAAGLYPYPEIPEGISLFIGRFHPLVVHMPIGFIAAVLILQLVSLVTDADLRAGISALLWFTVISAILAAVIGTLLALPGGYDERLLDQHRWLGIATSVACIWLLAAHLSMHEGSGILYTLFLLISMGLVGATGHWGGSLTHGEDYLTAYLPEALGGKAPPEPVDPGTKEDAAIYGRVIQPILANKCVECHSPSKSNGDLRMHDLASLLEGGKHGPSLIPNNAAESLVVQRVLLPLDEKEHMPPKGKVQLTEAELDTISWWINQGAPERMSLDTDLPADATVAYMENVFGFAFAPPKLEMLSWDETVVASEALHENPDVRIRRVALDAPALDVFFEPGTNNIDELLFQLEPIKANITLLDLGNTVFTDAGLEKIGTFLNLEQLRLHQTPITDENIAHLQGLRKLNKLNLYGTQIGDAAMETLTKLPNLRQVTTWDTQVTFEAAEDFMASMIDKDKQRKLQQKIHEFESQLKALDVEVVGVEKVVLPTEASPKLFNLDKEKYGELLTSGAQVLVSSTTEYDPPNGLKTLVQDLDHDLPFTFHTKNELNPWVQFRFDRPITLNAFSIKNRTDVQERAAGLTLESSSSDPAAYTLHVTNIADTKLTEYELGKRLSGRYVVMRFNGPGSCNPGGNELVLGHGGGSSYRDKVLALNPITYYTFDADELVDADTVKNLGSLPNTATLAGGAAFTGLSGGISGGGLNIDDAPDQMLRVDKGSIDLQNDWTISSWFQGLHNRDAFRTLTRSDGDGNDHQLIVNNGTDDLGAWNNDAAGGSLPGGFRDSGYDLKAGDKTWHHIVAVGTGGDAGQTDFYIDGKHVGTADQGSSGNISVIGNYQGGRQAFAQVIDEFAVFNSALSAGQIATLASMDTAPAKASDKKILPDPVKATASTEFSAKYAVSKLYDGAVTLNDLGTTGNQGQDFAGKGVGPHVVVYDMGAPVTFDRIFYAQRHNACDKVNTIEFWVTNTDPGPASTSMTVLHGTNWRELFKVSEIKPAWHVDLTERPEVERQAKYFRLMVKQENPAYLHLAQVRLWGKALPPSAMVALFDRDTQQFGERISSLAKVTATSTSQYAPPSDISLLVQDKDNGLPYAFHTGEEKNPWVQFSYDQPVTLNAISIRNPHLPKRAEGLALESSQDGKTWEPVWGPLTAAADWQMDLTGIPKHKRKAPYFRLVVKNDALTYLHLGQVWLWGEKARPVDLVAQFDNSKKRYGERVSAKAKVTLSSTSSFAPLNELNVLVQDKDNGLPYAFHTSKEKNPWVQFSYDHPIILQAINIKNRPDIPHRAEGLALESSADGLSWQEVWKPAKVATAWQKDLTSIPEGKRKAQHFRLIVKKDTPTFLHLGQVGLWGKKAAVPPSIALFKSNPEKYGTLISRHAKVAVSSTTPHDPPDGLRALTQDEDNGLPFAFHTGNEEMPWVQFSYDQPTTLNALSIRNRGNLQERAHGLGLQSSTNGSDWQTVWTSADVKTLWHLNLTDLPADQRKAQHFRLIILKDGPATLHLGQVRLWGMGFKPPAQPAKPAAAKPAAPPATKPAPAVKSEPKPAAKAVPAPASKPEPAPAAARTGQGAWVYEVVRNWGKVPGHDHIGTTNGDIVVDKSGNVYVSTDGPNGLILYQEDGTFIKSFGASTRFYHGMNIYEENGKEYIYAAAMGSVVKLDLEGNVVQKIEGAKQPAGHTWAKATAVAVAPNGDIFIADGYGSSVIFKYDRKGTFIKKFGLRGKADGQFIVSHGLAIDARNPDKMLLMVCDRENRRLQHFDLDGNFVEVIINDLRQPCSASIRGDFVLVAELGGRAVIIDKNHQVVSVLGDNPKLEERAKFGVPPHHWIDGVFTAPHGCSFDAKGNLYIQDWNKWGRITKLVRASNLSDEKPAGAKSPG